jgi:hypothetical protein
MATQQNSCRWTFDKVSSKLKEIQASVPEVLRKAVIIEVKATPTVEMVMKHASTMESISEEKREQINTLLQNGDFSKTKFVENKKIAKQIDNYVSRKINEAVRNRQLPNRKELKKLMETK